MHMSVHQKIYRVNIEWEIWCKLHIAVKYFKTLYMSMKCVARKTISCKQIFSMISCKEVIKKLNIKVNSQITEM